jgi:uncharacterized protein (DUF2141 family)
MNNSRYGRVLMCCIVCTMCASTVAAGMSTGTVSVSIAGIRADQGGSLIIMLFRGAEGWLDIDKAFLKKIATVESDSMAVVFRDVPYDSTYAVEIVHDRNGNGKLDMRKFPYPRPKEGAGVSNNTFRLGPPSYDKARFELGSSSVSLRVIMRY